VDATETQLTDLKPLALRVLERNRQRNQQRNRAATGAKKGRNFCPPKEAEKLRTEMVKKRPYRFRLRDGEGGVYLSTAANVQEARERLVETYGDRLALVVEGLGNW